MSPSITRTPQFFFFGMFWCRMKKWMIFWVGNKRVLNNRQSGHLNRFNNHQLYLETRNPRIAAYWTHQQSHIMKDWLCTCCQGFKIEKWIRYLTEGFWANRLTRVTAQPSSRHFTHLFTQFWSYRNQINDRLLSKTGGFYANLGCIMVVVPQNAK